MHPPRHKCSILAIALLLTASRASANAGVPMLYLIWPASWLLLVPIVLVEAYMANRILNTLPARSLAISAASNLASTVIGIPLTWVLLVSVELLVTSGGRAYGMDTWATTLLAFTVQAPWLIPYDSAVHWLIPAAAMVLCLPFLLSSVVLEFLVATWVVRGIPRTVMWRWSWRANLLTYGSIVLGLAALLIRALLYGPTNR